MPSELELIARLATAGALGAAIGLEREARAHAAGVRTHALVALGAALFTVAGAYGFEEIHHGETADPTRVAAQIASGIGFLGAGAIIRHGTAVRGLTTAATLWVSAALGLAAGAGLYVVAVAGTGLLLFAVVGMRLLKPALLGWFGSPLKLIEVEYERGHGTLAPLMRGIEELNGRLTAIRLEDDESPLGEAGLQRVEVELAVADTQSLNRLVEALHARPEVRSATWSSATRAGRDEP